MQASGRAGFVPFVLFVVNPLTPALSLARRGGKAIRSLPLAVLMLACGGCLLPGCTFDASKIAGFSSPGIEYQPGKRVRVSSDFAGTLKVEFHPDGSLKTLDVNVRKSDVSPVVDAEGRRAEYLPAAYEIVAQSYAQQTAAWVGLIDSLISKAISAAPSLMEKWATLQAARDQGIEGSRDQGIAEPRMDAEER